MNADQLVISADLLINRSYQIKREAKTNAIFKASTNFLLESAKDLINRVPTKAVTEVQQ
jgi:hypothetical protein